MTSQTSRWESSRGEGPTGYMRNVRTCVKRIRRKFVDADPAFDALKTHHGFGYRWESA